jgi:hypothetical protein
MRHLDYRLYEPNFFDGDTELSSFEGESTMQYDDGADEFGPTEIKVEPLYHFMEPTKKLNTVRLASKSDGNGVMCTGNIIDKHFILTSASCVKKFS